MRSSGAYGHADNRIITGPIVVDLARHEVTIGKNRLNLTSKEYHILELLSLRKGSTLTKSHFINYLYGGIDEQSPRLLMSLSASFGASFPTLLAAKITFIPFGVRVMSCGIQQHHKPPQHP